MGKRWRCGSEKETELKMLMALEIQPIPIIHCLFQLLFKYI